MQNCSTCLPQLFITSKSRMLLLNSTTDEVLFIGSIIKNCQAMKKVLNYVITKRNRVWENLQETLQKKWQVNSLFKSFTWPAVNKDNLLTYLHYNDCTVRIICWPHSERFQWFKCRAAVGRYKLKEKKASARPRRTWIGDLLQWTQKNKLLWSKKTDRRQWDIEKRDTSTF